MIVERIYAANELRNYHYIVACSETGEALVIDPLDWRACLDLAKSRGWTIRQIVNTHEHRDHTGGNAELVKATGATVLAHAAAADIIGDVDVGLEAWDVVKVGRNIEMEVLDTPGHTLAHVCLLAHVDGPALFAGDTLFNAGVGNCRQGGDPELLYATCVELLSHLELGTRIYPGHDYMQNNLRFTRHVEPGNRAATDWLRRCTSLTPETMPVLTLADELKINSFFRLASSALVEGLRRRVPDLSAEPDTREVFLRLRELRNSW